MSWLLQPREGGKIVSKSVHTGARSPTCRFHCYQSLIQFSQNVQPSLFILTSCLALFSIQSCYFRLKKKIQILSFFSVINNERDSPTSQAMAKCISIWGQLVSANVTFLSTAPTQHLNYCSFKLQSVRSSGRKRNYSSEVCFYGNC